MTNQLRAAIIERAANIGLTPEAIAELCGQQPPADHIYNYLIHRTNLGEFKLARVCNALSLTLTPRTNMGTSIVTDPIETAAFTISHDDRGYLMLRFAHDYRVMLANLNINALQRLRDACENGIAILHAKAEEKAFPTED